MRRRGRPDSKAHSAGRAWRHPGSRAAVPAVAGRGRGAAPATAPAGPPSPKDLKYPPLRAIQPPDAASFTLPNGMKLYLMEDHDLPQVSGTALVRTGSLLDPPQRIGLAQLAGITMRTGGTVVKTGEQIDTLLDNSAAHHGIHHQRVCRYVVLHCAE